MTKLDFQNLIVNFEKDEYIYKEGDNASTMFIIHQGKVKLFKTAENGEELVLGEYGKGDFFGEMAVLGEHVRTENAIALEPVKVIVISKPVFIKILKNNAEIAIRMIRKFSEKLKDANRMIATLLKQKQLPVNKKGEHFAYLELPEFNQKIPLTSNSIIVGRYDPVIGIYPDIDISPFDPQKTVSRKHAIITREGRETFIEEQIGVINGTFLNGERIKSGKKYKLKDGDKIFFGLVKCVYKETKPKH